MTHDQFDDKENEKKLNATPGDLVDARKPRGRGKRRKKNFLRKKNRRARVKIKLPKAWLTVRVAAPLLQVTANALRARLRRAEQMVAGKIVADLGVAEGEKLGKRSWRVRIK